jgi:TatD DNase family protein
MIDCHCHLEQKDYNEDRDAVIEKCRQQLQAIVTSCAHPKDFKLTMELVDKHAGFIFSTVGIHPEYIKKISEQQKNGFVEIIRANRNKIVGIGETGLDYNWVKEEEWREKQRQMFVEFIELAKNLKLPLVIHSRDAYDETVEILEENDAKQVMMHMFGANNLAKRVASNGWFVSMNTILLKSKKHKKVVRDMPMDQLLLETDAPWLAPEGFGSKRNDSTAVKFVAEKIAEIKKIALDDVDKITTENAEKFFGLKLKI